METTIIPKLALSFLIGGVVVSMATGMADRFGSRIGGVIGGLPSTVVVALLFIGWIRGPERAADAATLVPLAIALIGPFLIVYALTAKAGLIRSLSLTLGTWFVLSALIVLIGINNLLLSMIGGGLIFCVSFLILEKGLKIRSMPRSTGVFSLQRAVERGLFGGGVILGAVLLSELGGPFIGGIFACFPAVLISIIVIVYHERGPAFSVAVAKSLMVSAIINVALYGIAVYYLYPAVGIWVGTLIALAIACVSGYVTLRFIAPRLS